MIRPTINAYRTAKLLGTGVVSTPISFVKRMEYKYIRVGKTSTNPNTSDGTTNMTL